MTRKELHHNIKEKKSLLCVGLDPVNERLPKEFRDKRDAYLHFCKWIIELTRAHTVAYKVNIAFFEALGPHGWEQLEKLRAFIPSDCMFIADAKRGDIGNTSTCYARYYFERLNADAITLSPYMGVDSLQPFLNYEDKFQFVLGLTSNTGAADIEKRPLQDGSLVYQQVLKSFYRPESQIGFVLGATQAVELKTFRAHCPDAVLLIPGVGVQGGNLQSVLANTVGKNAISLINSSRSIIYAKGEGTPGENIIDAARGYQIEMAEFSERI